MTSEKGERLQKVLARAGLGSRRACEELIVQGRVTIDGRAVSELGTRVDPDSQRVTVDGEPVHAERPIYCLLKKPRGVLCTNYDPEGRVRVVDLVPRIAQRVFTVGRLDEESEGLLLLTNDGELANRLAHPRYGVQKTYRVQVAGLVAPDEIAKLTHGMWLSDGRVRADEVRRIGNQGRSTILEIVLSEGHNREVRRMLARVGHKILRLERIAIGPLRDVKLRVGQCRELNVREVQSLRDAVQVGEAGSGAPRTRRRPTRSRSDAPKPRTATRSRQ